MDNFYTAEKNVQMLIYLMKQHGIKKVIVSPGATNVTFVASIQQDSFFEMYSVADERSAAYMACGLAAASGEPVTISCTGATASRNYIPGLTEAYYRKLPILAVTSTQHTGRIGQLSPQVIDRSVIQNDIAVMNVQIPTVHDSEDEWDCNVKLNKAILALKHRGGGPVHINLTTTYSSDFSVKELPKYRVIRRISGSIDFLKIKMEKVGIFVGAHAKWSEKLTELVDCFCEKYNGVVFCDHTSNYQGKYRVQYNLLAAQSSHHTATSKMNLLIDMGEVSGAYMSLFPKEVWRVNPDGEIRDTFRKLTYQFDMKEETFYSNLVNDGRRRGKVKDKNTSYYKECKRNYNKLLAEIPELPFANAWMAQQTVGRIPEDSVLHLAILNSLRNWNFFELPNSITCYANTGGFGIDGIVSTLVGASLVNKNQLHFLVVGDLAFFYDLNAIANGNVSNNIRILLVNNGCGTEFKNYNHFAAKFGEDANTYMAAAGHYGQQSRELIKNYTKNLGFEYLCAETKEEYLQNLEYFVNPSVTDKAILFETFTYSQHESDALNLINHIIVDEATTIEKTKQAVKGILGEKGIQTFKKWVKG